MMPRLMRMVVDDYTLESAALKAALYMPLEITVGRWFDFAVRQEVMQGSSVNLGDTTVAPLAQGDPAWVAGVEMVLASGALYDFTAFSDAEALGRGFMGLQFHGDE